MSLQRVRWGDLISPRAMYSFTISDAVNSLPTLLAMGGCFLGGIIIIYIIKCLLLWWAFRKQNKKYILDSVKTAGKEITNKVWIIVPIHNFGTVWHLLVESMFSIGVVVVALFAAAVGDINIWQSPIATVGIGLIGTYVFGQGLQQMGSGYFFFLTNSMSYGEYWELIGSTVEGRVSRISIFHVEFETFDVTTQSAVLIRTPMTTIMSGNWKRNYHKEQHAVRVSKIDMSGHTKEASRRV
ncbi:MAG: hypothetical protein DRI46_12760, partial [Chloroflexi bacterium]